jgi:glycogen operon protein
MQADTVSEMATRLCGSSDLYQDDGRKPYHSVNFITAHDGFTLYDLASYNYKNNQMPYPYGPSDGGEDNNNSRDWGVEWLKKQQVRNLGCLMLLAQGTPMLLGGDEFGRTQRGNNNAYNLDTVCSWVDFSLKDSNARLWKFFQGLIAFRKSCGALQRTNFFTGRDNDGDSVPDVQWHGCGYRSPDWSSNARVLAFRLDGSREETGAAQSHGDIYVAINSWQDGLTFELPPNHSGKRWYRVVETAAWAENNATIQNNIEKPGEEDVITDGTWTALTAASFGGGSSYRYTANGHSVVVLIEK